MIKNRSIEVMCIDHSLNDGYHVVNTHYLSYMQDSFRPSMYIPIQDCCKHPLLRSWMLLIQLFYKFLRILSLGIAVNGTTACDNRKLILVPESDHICLLYKHDRTDHRQLHTIQITSGRKSVLQRGERAA